jgi:hypothetical protein
LRSKGLVFFKELQDNLKSLRKGPKEKQSPGDDSKTNHFHPEVSYQKGDSLQKIRNEASRKLGFRRGTDRTADETLKNSSQVADPDPQQIVDSLLRTFPWITHVRKNRGR